MKGWILVICTCLIVVVSAHTRQRDLPKLTGPYFGQKPPGRQPALFAPGIISVEENAEHSAAVFSPDNKEMLWCTNKDWYTDNRVAGNLRLYYMKMVNGEWTAPRVFPVTKDIRAERPVFSPDGNRIYVECGSDPEDAESDTDIYVIERNGDGWSAPTPLSSFINTPAFERLHCVIADGSLYFSRDLMTGREEVFVSKYVNGEFTAPLKLGKDFNSSAAELVILVAPDEKYMLIGQTSDGRDDELYICYKKTDGSWTDRIRTPYPCGGFLSLSPDGKYLFFLGDGIFWVSTSFVEEFRSKE